MPLVYTRDRVRRLRLLLGVDVFAGLLLALLSVFFVATDEGLRREALTIGALGLLVIAVSVFAFLAVARGDSRARLVAATTGVVTLVVGLFFFKLILGFALIAVGLLILVLALLPDEPEPVA